MIVSNHKVHDGSAKEGEQLEQTNAFPTRLQALTSTRFVLDKLVTAEDCAELMYIHKCVCCSGYRPGVRSTTCHDVLRCAPHLLLPLVAARSRVWQAVEECMGLDCELSVEFTGLMSWVAGSSLGWHYDANRPYLTQRHVSAVLYLNTKGMDFKGGDLCFQDGPEPVRLSPQAGQLVVYTAGPNNVHCVEEVLRGERYTLTLWFSLDAAAAEDRMLVPALSALDIMVPPPGLAPSMFMTPQGVDLRLQRLHQLGWQLSVTDSSTALPLQQQEGPDAQCLGGHGAAALLRSDTAPMASGASSAGSVSFVRESGVAVVGGDNGNCADKRQVMDALGTESLAHSSDNVVLLDSVQSALQVLMFGDILNSKQQDHVACPNSSARLLEHEQNYRDTLTKQLAQLMAASTSTGILTLGDHSEPG